MANKKRRTPLQRLILSVVCESCANGTIRVTPKWHGKLWTPEDVGGPGIITRLYAARHLAKVINFHLKGKR